MQPQNLCQNKYLVSKTVFSQLQNRNRVEFSLESFSVLLLNGEITYHFEGAKVLVIEEAQPWFALTGENFYFDPSIWLKNTLSETGFFYKKRASSPTV